MIMFKNWYLKMAINNNDFDFKSPTILDSLSVEKKVEYFKELNEYIMTLPFDNDKLDKEEKKFLKTVDFLVPKFKKIYEPNIYYKNNEKIDEPFILVSNHLGSFDQALLCTAFPDRAFHYMIAESLLTIKNLYVGKLYVNRGAFVVDRTTSLGRKMAIPNALQYVYRGRNLAMFPEASRQILYGSDGSVQSFKNGAVAISQIGNIPIVPMAINNNYSKGNIYINVGEKFRVNVEDKIIDKNIELRDKIIDLWNENKSRGALILTKEK